MKPNKKNNIENYKVIDLFAGAGGLSNGFEQTGKFEVLGAVEINPAAVKTYIRNHDNNEDIIIKENNGEISDITKIDFYKFINCKNLSGDEIIIIGGPPCQGFSNANRQKNYLISGNNQLVKEFVRAVDEIKPVAFLLENVKTMKSEVHKFFVTEHIEETIFSYSSEEHLSLITKKDKEKLKKLLKQDSITLIETKHENLRTILEQIFIQDEIKPIIENKKYISRLRSIERYINKSNYIKLKTKKEINEVSNLIKYLKGKVDNDSFVRKLKLNSILTSAIKVLNLVKEQEINKEEIQNNIGPLIDLNRFILNYKELIDEKIIFEQPLCIHNINNKITVNANVKSYNIVEYLEYVFSYYGYEIDYNTLDASDFGVPQRRNRFMFLGVKEKFALKEVKLPLKSNFFINKSTTKDAISDLEEIPPQKDIVNYTPTPYNEFHNLSLLQCYYRKNSSLIFNHINTKSRELSIKRFKAIKESGGENFHSLSDDMKSTYTDSSRTQNTIYLRLNYFEPSPTVVNVRKSMWNHPKNAVALSIREAARLQSFRDNFIFFGTKDQQYQQVGNAVPPLLARAVAEKLLNIIGDKPVISIEEEFKEYK
ncbi:DNA cytosine methyltransferase [Halalkalibacterium halodurans]|uniref:DNA cytosine methyltransferase n=1 Tax=Halalkalibacterium halodurans TaxID=86665 RepID=UPI002E1D82FF|nr:DNA cytosine methyltransferase [Halalkalibacterium halodurans]MED4107061.1 DNA cytosine methyltransferase [Halalkalibacterium halodurans]MED4111219.1 DNA cytosine methyltransferase [Halalkalibacterium halodurans]MED4150681.1 DNA cytosine methyltransferase [Halalkalibacterium halodurans]MED4188949.1 DNA cytosine methyltransferase [Halalkalibacterium halodurans]